MATQSSLPTALKRSASSFARQITMMARSLAPAHIQGKIKTSVVEEGDGVIRITTTVKAPDAHAQEYGSGLCAQRGIKAKYPITPKPGTKFLEFDGTNAFDGWLIRTRLVMHPGINAVNEGKGYIRPTYAEFRKKLKGNSELNNAIHKAIISDIRRSFTKDNY